MSKLEIPYFISYCINFNLDDCVEWLKKARNDSTNFYIEFLGHKLYSDTVTLDSAYQEVYQMTREEYKSKMKKAYMKFMENERKMWEEIRKEAKERNERILEKGKEVIPEDKLGIYKSIASLLSHYGTMEEGDKKIDIYLSILKQLNEEDFDLERIKEQYLLIKTSHVPENLSILESIRDIAVHGKVLYDCFYDKEKAEKIRKAQEEMQKKAKELLIPGLIDKPPRELTLEEKVDNYDRRVTTLCMVGYAYSKPIQYVKEDKKSD